MVAVRVRGYGGDGEEGEARRRGYGGDGANSMLDMTS